MKKLNYLLFALLAVAAVACAGEKPKEQAEKAPEEKPAPPMPDMAWFEIPATNLQRAVKFYNTILGVELKVEKQKQGAGESEMAFFPAREQHGLSGHISVHPKMKPGAGGTLIYLKGGKDVQPILDRVEKAGGKILVPKTDITPELGHFAIIQDTEGNVIGLHAPELTNAGPYDMGWFELATADLARAKTFYTQLWAVDSLVQEQMGPQTLVCFPQAKKTFSGALVKDAKAKPGMAGPLVYLNCGNDLAPMLARAEKAGAKVLLPKTDLPENMGSIAVFMDSEGNQVGLYAMPAVAAEAEGAEAKAQK